MMHMSRTFPLMVITLAVLNLSCSNSKTKTSNVQLKSYPSPADSVSGEPFLFTDNGGTVYLSYLQKEGMSHALKLSSYDGNSWSAPGLVASDSNWFVNWADYPMVVADGSGNFLAHVLAKGGVGTYAYNVNMYTSNDAAKSWSPPFILHDDGQEAEHGFVSMTMFEDKFFVAWLDGRNTVMHDMKETNHNGHHGAMSLRAALLDTNGTKVKEWELDNRTCDCCQTSVSVTANGPVVVYRDRSDEEIRDIAITRLVNGKWTEPQSIHDDKWKINGCPVNGPRTDARENVLAIAWFTAPDGNGKVKVVFSEDSGETFGSPILISDAHPIGRVDIVLINKDRAVVTWMESEEIKAVTVDRDGEPGTPFSIAVSSSSRASGFPQMTLARNELIFAWTDDREKKIKVAGVSVTELQ